MQTYLNAHGYIMNTTRTDDHTINNVCVYEQYPRNKYFCGEIV